MKAFLSEYDEVCFWEADEKLGLIDFFEKQKFRAADTPLTYRQIHILDQSGLLSKNAQGKENTWRRFSFKEVVFLHLVTELKQFGLTNTQLTELYYAFFKDPKDKKRKWRGYAVIPLGFVFGGVGVSILVRPDGDVTFCDNTHFPLCLSTEGQLPSIVVNLNEIVQKVIKKLGGKTAPKYETLFSDFLSGTTLDDKEKELIELVRMGDCNRIEVTMKDGQINVLRKTQIRRNPFTPGDLAKMLEGKAYAKVTIQMEDGKTVVHEIEEKRKV